MHHTQDPGTISLTDGTQGASRLSVPGHTTNYNAGTRYSRLLHRRCASLDLEAAFKEIKISQNVKTEVCTECRIERCRCPAFMPGRRAHLHHQHLPILVVTTNTFPTWWKTNRCMYCILLCNHLQTKKQIEKLQRFAEHLYTTR